MGERKEERKEAIRRKRDWKKEGRGEKIYCWRRKHWRKEWKAEKGREDSKYERSKKTFIIGCNTGSTAGRERLKERGKKKLVGEMGSDATGVNHP